MSRIIFLFTLILIQTVDLVKDLTLYFNLMVSWDMIEWIEWPNFIIMAYRLLRLKPSIAHSRDSLEQ
jgi:hypothetical protein